MKETHYKRNPEIIKLSGMLERDRMREAEEYLSNIAEHLHPFEHDYCKGLLLQYRGDKYAALDCFEAALEKNEHYHPAFASAAELYISEGYPGNALDCYRQACFLAPENKDYLRGAGSILGHFRFTRFDPAIKSLLLECFEHSDIEHYDLGSCWASILFVDPANKELFSAGLSGKYSKFSKIFFRRIVQGKLLDEFILTGLKKTVVPEIYFEKILTELRRVLLDYVSDQRIPDENFVTFAQALACYCFNTEYIFEVSKEEKQKLGCIETENNSPREAAVLACYGLRRLPEHRKESETLYELSRKINSLTKIDEGISVAVRNQYENSPYPRWNALSSGVKDKETEGFLMEGKPDILVAGCGTGREAIELAAALPDSSVVAVDLSRNSLAYGSWKSVAKGVDNIEFAQADILELSDFRKRFDFIACSGVLHHMEDPLQGWRILTGLLKPEGVMRIALYSKIGRSAIARARKVISGKGYAADPGDIRRFRSEAPDILSEEDYKVLTDYRDYYFMPECRDLLFHVQEHRFSLLQIREMIAELNLEFWKFYLPSSVISSYKKDYPGDSRAINLENWHKYETANPDTFRAMYRFWCKAN